MNAHETTDPHLNKAGKKRRSKKDAVGQLGIFTDNERIIEQGVRSAAQTPLPHRWEEVSLMVTREDGGVFIQWHIQDENGFITNGEESYPTSGLAGTMLAFLHAVAGLYE